VPPLLHAARPRDNPERIAHLLHRATGLLLAAYFAAHAAATGLLFAGSAWAAGAAAFLATSKPLLFLVASSAAFHGLNGLRLLAAEALALGVGKPGIPRPPYVSQTLRAGQRRLLDAAVVGFAAAAAVAAYTLLTTP